MLRMPLIKSIAGADKSGLTSLLQEQVLVVIFVFTGNSQVATQSFSLR
jgi:hypothetical protein